MNSNNSFITIDDFELGKGLGIGQFGQVWLAKHKKEGFICAIKIIEFSKISENVQVKNIRREIEIHLNLSHPNIISMYGYFYDSERLYCVLEYAGNEDVYSFLDKKGKLTELETKVYIRQIADAIEYLHKQNIIHRDIKPENILIGCDDKLKLADFGWSVVNLDNKRDTFCGTKDYLSPEICQEKIYTKAIDIWCIGILCYELLTGECPFDLGNKSLQAIKHMIPTEEIKFPSYLSKEAISFIKKCTIKNPEYRITINEVLQDSFLQ